MFVCIMVFAAPLYCQLDIARITEVGMYLRLFASRRLGALANSIFCKQWGVRCMHRDLWESTAAESRGAARITRGTGLGVIGMQDALCSRHSFVHQSCFKS